MTTGPVSDWENGERSGPSWSIIMRWLSGQTPMSHLLGEAVLAEVRGGDRVLDMGTGSGVNAILAASKGAEVVAVDINARAIEAAVANAERNGVADRVVVRHSDVFSDNLIS